jgi:hypothetical protein
VAIVTGEDFLRQSHMRIFYHITHYCKNRGRLRSGPKAVCLDVPKLEFIDVLADRIPSGL